MLIFVLMLLISFAPVNAVLFTPALPAIEKFFAITAAQAQLTVTLYLIGYAIGPLIYGPIANRYGRKPTLYYGVTLLILSSLLCVFAGHLHEFALLAVGRFLMALGSSVGLKMTFTLVSEYYEVKRASRIIGYLLLVCVITPGFSVTLGGILTAYFSWTSCFYASTLYGIIMLALITRLPETLQFPDLGALKINQLLNNYRVQFRNLRLILGGLLLGGCSSLIYVFHALVPFIAINIYGMSSLTYGMANLLPLIGVILGSLTSAALTKKFLLTGIIRSGIVITSIGVLCMVAAQLLHSPIITSIFIPTAIIYFGIMFISPNTSVIVMKDIQDKSHGAAVMSFVNVGTAILVVLNLGLFPIHQYLLISTYFVICISMALISRFI